MPKHCLALSSDSNIFDKEDIEPSVSTILNKLTKDAQVVKVRCRSCKMYMRPTKCSQR